MGIKFFIKFLIDFSLASIKYSPQKYLLEFSIFYGISNLKGNKRSTSSRIGSRNIIL